MTWKRIEEHIEKVTLGIPTDVIYVGLTEKQWEELDKSCKRALTRIKKPLFAKTEFQAKGEYDPKAFQEVVKGMPLSCLIETNYVKRSWILSPRGRASVIEAKFVFDGYLDKFEPQEVKEGEDPEFSITVPTLCQQ